MATVVPFTPQNCTAEQADGNILVSWQGALGATGYQVQRSTDGVNYSNLATTTTATTYIDSYPGIGIMFFYQVLATNTAGSSVPSNPAMMVAAPPSEMSLYELRLRSQQTADRVNSDFVSTPEWNAFIRLACYELYDLLIDSYEDLFSDQYVFINTNGNTQNYPVPDGATNYPGGIYSASVPFTFALPNASNATINAVYQQNNFMFTVSSTISGGTSLSAIGNGTPSPSGVLALVSGTGQSEIAYNSYAITLSQPPAQAFYKLVGMDLGINTSNNAWVTLLKYDFIERNKYVYPNSTSTIYGVYNMRYRLMGTKVNLIPTPAGNQQIRMWYAPRLPSLLADNNVTTIGFSGWLRYVIVRAAKYALDKEEGSDTSKLDEELLFLKTRIEQASQNRDVGVPDTISQTRQDSTYGGTGWNGGGNNAGW